MVLFYKARWAIKIQSGFTAIGVAGLHDIHIQAYL
jgi:hypothetical protein